MQIQLQIADNTLTFQLYPLGTQFNRISGIYTFFIIPVAENLGTMAEVLEASHPEQACTERSRSIEGQHYSLLYAGITNNFQKRISQHNKINQAIELGMTHIGILKISSGRKRKSTERKLLKTYHPPLNRTWFHDNS